MANANGKGTVVANVFASAVQAIATVLGVGFVPTVEVKRLSVSQRADHRTPNLAALLLAIRSVLNVSQGELGSAVRKNGEPLFGSIRPAGSGWFSLIANVEQGGRRTAVPVAFGQYLADALGIDVRTITAAIDMDNALIAAVQNRNANRTHAAIVVCQLCAGTLAADGSDATVTAGTDGNGLVVVHKGECPTA